MHWNLFWLRNWLFSIYHTIQNQHDCNLRVLGKHIGDYTDQGTFLARASLAACDFETDFPDQTALFNTSRDPFFNRITGVRAYISNHMHPFMWDAITHPCGSFNGGLVI